jgi:hypothetical protein
MRPDTLPTWNGAPPRRRNRAPLVITALLCAVVVLSVAGTLLYAGGKVPFARLSSTTAQSATATTIVAHPIPNLPPIHEGSVPPMTPRLVVGAGTPYPTPCAASTPTAPPLKLNPPSRSAPVRGNVTPSDSTLPACPDGSHPIAHTPCYYLPGTAPTQDQVRQAMYNLAVSKPFSFSLIEAIGWQESGWQAYVVACDGGVGLMQMMPDTTAWLNQTNGTNYSPNNMDGNLHLGVDLLTWEYNYYIPFCNQGMPAGQTCNWDTPWPGGTDGATVRQIVISSYNQGIGTTAKYGIQNWGYVNSVMALWQQFLAAEK